MGNKATIITPINERKKPNKNPSAAFLPFCLEIYLPNKPNNVGIIKINNSCGKPIANSCDNIIF